MGKVGTSMLFLKNTNESWAKLSLALLATGTFMPAGLTTRGTAAGCLLPAPSLRLPAVPKPRVLAVQLPSLGEMPVFCLILFYLGL